jgi:hypothetical protein
MDSNELEKKLENISSPQLPPLQHQEKLKLSILSAKKSSRASLILLAFPFILFLGGILQGALNILLPPWSWMVKYSPLWPVWLRMLIYVMILIVFPLAAAFINILAITWIEYDKNQKVLNISIRIRTVNTIIIIATLIIALLFIGHSIGEWISGAE